MYPYSYTVRPLSSTSSVQTTAFPSPANKIKNTGRKIPFLSYNFKKSKAIKSQITAVFHVPTVGVIVTLYLYENKHKLHRYIFLASTSSMPI